MRYSIYTQDEYMGKIKIVVSDQQPFMIDGIIGFLGHYPDLYEVVGGYKDLKKAIAECNKSAAQIFILGENNFKSEESILRIILILHSLEKLL